MGRLKCLKPPLAQVFTSGWKPDAVRGSRHQRGYGYEWEKKREGVKERAKNLCEPHLAIGILHLGSQCDHKTHKAQGGSDADENLHWVCEDFHSLKTARESRGDVVDIEAIARETAGGRR